MEMEVGIPPGDPLVDTSYNSGSRIPPFPDYIHTAPLLTISLAKILASNKEEHERLFTASRSLGFFYLDMRECVEGEMLLSHAGSMFSLMNEFFKLPMEEKRQYDLSKKGSYFGYKGKGKEVMDDQGNVDHNEMYNISKDDILAISDPLPAPFIIGSNRPLLQSYVQSNHLVLTTLFGSLSTSLGLPPDTFANLHRFDVPSGCHARFIQVHPYPDLLQQTLGEHTDFGSLSILFNRLGGLQVQLPDSHNWVYVRPVAGSAIVNLGDAMVKFSAGILRSNLHRVVSPPGEQAGLMRHSLVYFCRPEHEAILKRVEGGLIDAEGEDNGEEGVSSREWLERRHLARKIGVGAVGFQRPGDLAKGKGTEGSRIALDGKNGVNTSVVGWDWRCGLMDGLDG